MDTFQKITLNEGYFFKLVRVDGSIIHDCSLLCRKAESPENGLELIDSSHHRKDIHDMGDGRVRIGAIYNRDYPDCKLVAL